MKQVIITVVISITALLALFGCKSESAQPNETGAVILPATGGTANLQPTAPVDNTEPRPKFAVQYIRTDGCMQDREYPIITIIKSRAELEAYYEANKAKYELERKAHISATPSFGFMDIADKYTDGYFNDNLIVLVTLEEPSGSISHKVKDISNDNEKMNVAIERTVPEVGTTDMAQWHIIIELIKADYHDQTINVTLNQKA